MLDLYSKMILLLTVCFSPTPVLLTPYVYTHCCLCVSVYIAYTYVYGTYAYLLIMQLAAIDPAEFLSFVSLPGTHLLPTDTSDMSKRQKIVNEIYTSEQTYISQLSVIVDVSELVYACVCCGHVWRCVRQPPVG